MRRLSSLTMLMVSFTALAAESLVDRWLKAVGGRAKLEAVKAIYREATLEVGGLQGTIKVWHTAEGKYRKEEQVGSFSSVETFDGATAMVQRGAGPPQTLAGAELAIARAKAYANSNAMFFVFFPERRRGTLDVRGDDTIA